MKFEGIITNTIYRNQENGYSVLSINTSDGDITCTGIMPSFNVGDNVIIEGELIYHKTYGEQIQVSSIALKKPEGKKAIIKFLSSGSIVGIGKKTAELLYDEFKDKAIDVVFDRPEKLLKIPGIGKKKLESIKLSTLDLRDSRESLLYLQSLGISYNLAMKIYNKYKSSTIELVKTNPYKLVEDIKGIGFVVADTIAKNMQIQSDSKFRISAAITYILNREAEYNGHCTVEEKYLIEKTFELLNVDKEKIKEVIEEDIVKKKIISIQIESETYIYLYNIFKAEKSVAMQLSCLKKEEYRFCVKIKEKLDGFSDGQVQAINKAFENMLLVITGGPGTGKTTIIKAITKILDDNDLSYKLAAPTGRAAKRIQESTDQEAYTIHRLIGMKPDENLAEYNQENPLQIDYLIVDEVSMVDIYLMNNLLKALSLKTALILVGDSNQLPSVGPGNVLKDILESDIENVRLDKIFRQAGESNIVVNAHRINQGIYPLLNQAEKDFFFIDANPKNFKEKLIDLVTKRLPSYYKLDPINDIQILSPTKKSAWGVEAINAILQKELNSNPNFLEFNKKIFKKGDKVMQIRNNYDLEPINNFGQVADGIYNGDIGIIDDIDKDEEKLRVKFYDGTLVNYKREDIKDLDLSYAITIHKSQGSEFDCVVIPMMQASFMLLNRNLLYTGVTRAKKLLILLGEKRILKQMIDNSSTSKRNTNLTYWIKEMGEVLDD
ncbi:MAG: ATP-dependent RecD-like DNA helicase [Peptoniphilaceae bacterium]|nr:ATP-dependent RecD-like DNA helicase [Peptoniphilaceae bacterium]MDY6019104.1 ATP-dependent RecD-like DNA helicase [Anaerococcus sp.]